MGLEYKNNAAAERGDQLAHGWNSLFATTAVDHYLLPSELPPAATGVMSAYSRTVCLSLGSKEKGTGVILNDQWLLTCSHVIAEMIAKNTDSLRDIQVRTPNSELNLANASIEINDEELDFAIIRCPELRAPSIISSEMDASLYLSDRCYLVGNPSYATLGRPDPGKNSGQLLSIGRIEEIHDERIYVSGPTINPGYSGGPIIARDGSLLGIVAEQYGFGGRGPSMAAILNRVLDEKRG